MNWFELFVVAALSQRVLQTNETMLWVMLAQWRAQHPELDLKAWPFRWNVE